MSVSGAIRTAMESIRGLLPESVVTVVSGGRTASGIRLSQQKNINADEFGERGTTTSAVLVSAADIDEPQRGGVMTVAGETVFVMSINIDPVGGRYRIEYQTITQVEGV